MVARRGDGSDGSFWKGPHPECTRPGCDPHRLGVSDVSVDALGKHVSDGRAVVSVGNVVIHFHHGILDMPFIVYMLLLLIY